ncbi:hypothetical protein GW17_00041210 [Ensete ventricosum]|uniref:Uncharacterized protein n=1 Tax=Ensete ventricosum TaxID=4639 RepID=A0A444DD67_ENSVE|nr:hypothetical protein GW17_00041210 [Ensete ventricosum]RZR74957.1 hypothetical protein BHM03_00046659 [Ensete ventricosum]
MKKRRHLAFVLHMLRLVKPLANDLIKNSRRAKDQISTTRTGERKTTGRSRVIGMDYLPGALCGVHRDSEELREDRSVCKSNQSKAMREGCGAYSRAVLAIHPARLRGVKERPAFTTSRFRWGPLARARSGILLMFKQRTVIFPCITVWGPREIDRTRSSLTEFYDVKKAGPCPRSDIQSAGPALTVSVVDGRELDTSFWLGGGERRGKSLHDFFMKTFFHRMIPGDRVRSIIPTHFPSIYMLSSTDAVACSHARSRPSNALADQNFQS